MVGTKGTRLIVLRGNSTPGKSSVAAGLRENFGRGLALIHTAQRQPGTAHSLKTAPRAAGEE